jgi:hypothetical protein
MREGIMFRHLVSIGLGKLRSPVALAWISAFLMSAPAPDARAASFAYHGGAFDQVAYGDLDWGDFDGDGDLDLALMGFIETQGAVTWIYRNDGGDVFTRLPRQLASLGWGELSWGDLDGDGDLDLAVQGRNSFSSPSNTLVYRNDGSAGFSLAADVAALDGGAVAWGDHDNDGDLDLLVSGWAGAASTRIYVNTHGALADAGPALPPRSLSSAAWGDVDGDGKLDLALVGSDGAGGIMGAVLWNHASQFFDVEAPVVGVTSGATAWADVDADGDLDLAVQGRIEYPSTNSGQLLRNDGSGAFSSTSLPGLCEGALAWGDADNDGDPDLLATGSHAWSVSATRLDLNDGAGNLTTASAPFLPFDHSAAGWGDWDGDGDLDVALSGRYGDAYSSDFWTALYRNTATTPNTPPTAPGSLSATPGGLTTFAWSAASDLETATPGLTYNLRVGTTPGGNEIMPSMSLASGYRQVARLGNANHNTEWALALPPGTYYWSVQAVDAAFAGGPFAGEAVVVVPTTDVGDRIATGVALRAVAPNPFADRAAIEFELPRATRVALSVLDVHGRTVRTLSAGSSWSAGRHRLEWDGADAHGRPAAAGVYLVAIEAGGERALRRVVRIR